MKLILVEDDYFRRQIYQSEFKAEGFEVLPASNADEAKQIISNNSDAAAVILDVMFPPAGGLEFETKFGFESGRELASWIKNNYPALTVIGLSNDESLDTAQWFHKRGFHFLRKQDYDVDNLVKTIKSILSIGDPGKDLKIFIVHGHDKTAMLQLKNYLQNTLELGEPIILHELPSQGRTIMEKFEEESRFVDLVMVLLTPDDETYDPSTPNQFKRRSRQNVIFEMGYFFGKLQRKKGRVILLHKGTLELPSDITGLITIDISNGVEAAGEEIRRELGPLLKRP